MKELILKIADKLWEIPTMDKETVQGIVSEIKTEEIAKRFLDYLNQMPLKEMKYTPVIMYLDKLNGKELLDSSFSFE